VRDCKYPFLPHHPHRLTILTTRHSDTLAAAASEQKIKKEEETELKAFADAPGLTDAEFR